MTAKHHATRNQPDMFTAVLAGKETSAVAMPKSPDSLAGDNQKNDTKKPNSTPERISPPPQPAL